MTDSVVDRFGSALKECFEQMIRFESTPGNEAQFQRWFNGHLEALGFETVTWEADAEMLAGHPSFPNAPDAIEVTNRPSVGGYIEFGDPDAGKTIALSGHCDVVPVEPSSWSTPPFEPTWRNERVTARGAADMKAGLATCVYAGAYLAEVATDLNGRLVVESVVGEEEGGIGAAAAALDNPYPFDIDGVIIAEPTECRSVTATEGCLMKRLHLRGRSAHAATRWKGESVLPHFFRIHEMLHAFERERAESVTHPLYCDFENPWPINVGTVRAGNWASSVPADLEAEVRIGVAPGETVDEVEAAVDEQLSAVIDGQPWLEAHPPVFERFSIQFEPAEVPPDAPIVEAVRATLRSVDLDDSPVGATYGTDARHYLAAGIPTVVFGPGSIDQAHFPDETIEWGQVTLAADLFADAACRFISS